MAAGTFTLFSSNKDDLNPNDLVGATVKMALVTSSYTPDAAYNGHDEWADVSANEIANGNGYSTGGITLTNSVTGITGGFKFSTTSPSPIRWTASGGDIPTWKYAVMYVSGSLWGKTNPVVGYFEGESGSTVPATTSGNNLDITVPTNGWFDVT